MFEVPSRAALAAMSDHTLISAVTATTRCEAAVAARRLALVAEVTARHFEDEDDITAYQVIDGWAFANAEVSAACNLGARAASKQMRIAMALRTRLPRTAEVLAAGAVSASTVDAITWRTRLVDDADALALIDTSIAGEAAEYGTRSERGLIDAVDFWVEKFDPQAVIRSKDVANDVYVEFGDRDDPNGVSSFWGRLRVTDRKVVERRLDDLAATVCADDPRSLRERRADALAAMSASTAPLERLTCLCGDMDCAGSGKDLRSAGVTIYTLTNRVPPAQEKTAPAYTRPAEPGPDTEPNPDFEPGPTAASAPTVEPTAQLTRSPAPTAPGVVLDGGIIPPAMLAFLVETGAKVKPLADLADLPAEPRHDPSTKLTAFVRMRHLTCSFPGCSRPAHRCDLDHLIPWPAGATHPGNLAPACREHHLLKTFCGWTPTMAADGTIHWLSPTGHHYSKVSGSSILFPDNVIRIEIPPAGPVPKAAGAKRGLMMPKRRRTRAQENRQRIDAERKRNAEQIAREAAESNSDPPPF